MKLNIYWVYLCVVVSVSPKNAASFVAEITLDAEINVNDIW